MSTKKKTLQDAQSLAESKGGKCLSSEYKNGKTKMLWQCEFLHEWETKYSHILSGHWCPTCAKCKPKNLQDAVELAESKGGKCLSEKYQNCNTNMLWQCKYNHTWRTTYDSIRQGTWCLECSGRKIKTLQDAQQLAEYNNGKCLSDEYKNARELMKWQCEFGHIWEARYDGVRRGSWCAVCSNCKPKTLQDAKDLAESKGGKCLSEEYINNGITMLWQCEFGHTWKAAYDGVRSGTWCPCCPYKNESEVRRIFEEILGVKFNKTKQIFLNSRMELDGYNQDLKLGFEYQGQQHYNYNPHFHRNGETDLQAQQQRDQQKRDECAQLGITLIEIKFDVVDKEEYIKGELTRHKFI